MASLAPHPDRLLPADPAVRTIARRLYTAVRTLPILSPHGHVDPEMLAGDVPFTDPTSLFITPDHYVTRLLHAAGAGLDELGVGQGPLSEDRARAAWRILCGNWSLLRGTPVRYWFDSELADIFGITERPSAANADALYDTIATQLAQPSHRPRALLERFGIEFMATTDDPADALSAHAKLAADPGVRTRVVPTFRPDRYLEVARPGWGEAVRGLGAASDTDTGTTPDTSPRCRAAAGTSSSTARSPPTTRTPTRSPSHCPPRTPRASTPPRWPGRSARPTRPRSAGT